MRGRNKGSKNSRRGLGGNPWRGRGWSPARSAVTGNHNFRGEKYWNGAEDPIGFTNMNRQWIKQDQTNQIQELGLRI